MGVERQKTALVQSCCFVEDVNGREASDRLESVRIGFLPFKDVAEGKDKIVAVTRAASVARTLYTELIVAARRIGDNILSSSGPEDLNGVQVAGSFAEQSYGAAPLSDGKGVDACSAV